MSSPNLNAELVGVTDETEKKARKPKQYSEITVVTRELNKLRTKKQLLRMQLENAQNKVADINIELDDTINAIIPLKARFDELTADEK